MPFAKILSDVAHGVSNGKKNNSWLVRREYGGHVVLVNAHYIAPFETWGMTLKVDGMLMDHRQADDPLECATQMIEIAMVNLAALADVYVEENENHEEA